MSQPDISQLDGRVTALEELVAALAETLAARAGGGPWWWQTLGREEAARLWQDLAEFVTYLSGRYLSGLPAEYRVAACWYRHPVAVELLTALMVAHTGAYRDPGSEPGPGLVDFHERSLWPTLERLRHLRLFSSCQDGHTDRLSTAPTTPDDGFAAHVAADLATRDEEDQ
ncbi:hypothetical protein M3148_16235 [Georgenia satyanarayanai]|uniref:hypothetical protein n=1 Tax=Georgenia satyanarayanai TaxID=860221 RepID=UPI002041136A|nr:hypothetical protein [Georgenia satyanarayanai]MCM3662527.1 hypothetical protein [Georgenia satyanarayanai]